MEESGKLGAKGRGANIPALCIRNLLQRASAALEKGAFVRRAPENGHQALCRRTQLRFVGFLGIDLVHGMCDPQSVARFRYAHVAGVLAQPAVRLHQDSVSSAPVSGTPGLDKIVQEVEAPDHPARRDGTHTTLAMARRDDHDRAILAASNIDLL
jgi:hypothetical protein